MLISQFARLAVLLYISDGGGIEFNRAVLLSNHLTIIRLVAGSVTTLSTIPVPVDHAKSTLLELTMMAPVTDSSVYLLNMEEFGTDGL
jgi:hypothetical protein